MSSSMPTTSLSTEQMLFTSPVNFKGSLTQNGTTIYNSSGLNNFGLNEELLPFWILCESTSGFLSLLSIYIAFVLARYTARQSPSRLARRQRDSVMYPAKVLFPSMKNSSNQKISDISFTSNSCENEINDQKTQRVAYREQMSIESTKSQTVLITNSEDREGFHRGRVIAVHRSKEKDKGIWLMRAISICAFCVVLRCISEQCLILLGHFSNNACDVLTKTMTALTALSLHCCHVFLWLRQLTFYSNPILKPLRSKKLKILSYAAYGIMPLSLVAVLSLYMWWRDYEAVNGTCLAANHQHLPSYVPFGVLVACTVTIQVLLSALFLYPLIDHKIKRKTISKTNPKKCDSTPDSTPKTPHTVSRPKRSDKLMACIKRVLGGATVGITTDVVGGLVSIFLPNSIPMFAYSVLYNLNVSLNVFCLIYTFADWRQMLFPWCCPSRTEQSFRASKKQRRSSVKTTKVRWQDRKTRKSLGKQNKSIVVGKTYCVKILD